MAITRLLLKLVALALLAGVQPAAAQSDDADRYLRRGVYVDGQIWLLTDQGRLFRIVERTRRRYDVNLPDQVLALCRRNGDVLVATGLRNWDDWTVRRRSRGAWRIVARVRRAGDTLLAMDCTDGAPVTLLTSGRLIELRPGGPASVTLSDLTYARVSMTTFGTSEHLYVGLNSGEWGGGLRRIERGTGRTVRIEDQTAGPCRGPLDTNCDPVQGIARLPWRPGCIAAAIGLIHFTPHGRVVGICGDRVELLHSGNISHGGRGGPDATTDDPWSVAYFGIVQRGNELIAVGDDGLYRIAEGGPGRFEPFPPFRQIRGVRLSLDRPDFILAVTRINQRASVSGAVPLLIPR